MNRREFVKTSAACGLAAVGSGSVTIGADSAGFRFDPDKNIIPAPKDPRQWPAFRQMLAQWRDQTRRRLKYDDALYRRPEFAWTSSSFACCFLMMCDETFYDPRDGVYTAESFLDHGLKEFGAYDSLVLWHAYPRIGVDDRNQFDFYRDMPGGLEGLRRVVQAIQKRGTRVYIDYNPWDTGTRREGKPDVDSLVDMVRALGVDGIFLDTMPEGAAELRPRLDAVRPGVVLEGEGAVPLERIHDHHASWAQNFEDSKVPGILRHKWLERRHVQHQIRRWRHDHTAELHTAWINGSGMMVWENVFGAWVGWNGRDRSLLRAMLPIQRRYAALFTGEQWTPLAPTEKPDVYASLWQRDGLRLWTLVNRAENPAQGLLLTAEPVAGHRCFDLIAGRELRPSEAAGLLRFEGSLPPRGLGCFLSASAANLGEDFPQFLAAQAATNARADGNTTYPRRQTRPAPVAPTLRATRVPEGMVEVPAAQIEMTIEMRCRECGYYDSDTFDASGVGASYNFKTRQFRRRVELRRFAMDETPVTNAEFAAFLRATGYQPKHAENFLKHWRGGRPPVGKEDHPVVYVDLDDARAFARWAGKRLPTEEEWQYAAQGPDGRLYPWGNQMEPGRSNGGETGGTTPVKSFPEGRSPLGCYDMCGNVWEWTESERTDGRTRFCIIRGGSFYEARGSNWYVNGGARPVNFATKFLLMWPGLDRCGTIGFRCAVDLEQA